MAARRCIGLRRERRGSLERSLPEAVVTSSIIGHADSRGDHPLARSLPGPIQPKAPPCSRAGLAPPEIGLMRTRKSDRSGAPPKVGVLLAGGVAKAGAGVRVRSVFEHADTAVATRPDSSQHSPMYGPQMKARDGDIVEIVVTPPERRPTLRVAYCFS